jgi:nucleoside-diphosphate-sugar epimerase
MKVKNIIISGGSGFIGSNLCAKLIDRGDNVICLDNLITGSEKNIAPLLSRPNFKFINFDVCKSIDPRMYGAIDEIYHLASPADPNSKSPYSYMAHPFETMEVNTSATWKLCEFAVKKKAKILFTSTSEVYGDPQKSPQDETYRGNVSTTGPRAIYDEAKRFGETIVSAFVREKGLDGRITRIFNTYGPRMNPDEGRAVVNFINQAIKNENITIYGDGRQTRSFCYIDDQIAGQVLAMEKGQTAGEVFNIGNPDERTILEFAQMIKKLSESTSRIEFTDPMPEDDPMQRKPDITKAKKILGWTPKIALEAGLAATIEYFRKSSG